MLNSQNNYRFYDFTLENYKKILEKAMNNYKFSFYPDFNYKNDKVIILRHDVEFSIPIALKMSEIEADLGIKATYFLQIHSDFYNLLDKNNFASVKKIQEKGHQLGLHFDSHFWEITSEMDLEKYMFMDKQLLKQYFNIEPRVFSFHNNNAFTLSCEDDEYAGMINVYSKQFKENIGYCADSTGYWRYEILEDRLSEAKDDILQILIHDGMWQDEVLPPRRRIYKVIDSHADYMKKTYDETLKKFGASNIDWNGEV